MKNLIKFFSAAPVTGHKLEPERVIEEGAKRGYLIHPDCCTQEVLDFVRSEEFNPNSTFYRTWRDITDRTQMELFLNACMHYASTYGTDYEGEVYCPNGEPININYKTYIVIRAVQPEEMYRLCLDCLEAGAALADGTLKSLADYVLKCIKEDGYCIDIDKIANRDAQCYISTVLGILPTDGLGIIRCLFYQVFGNPMPIQGRAELNALLGHKWQEPTADVSRVDLTTLTEEQLVALSTVFLRYKKFMLGLKKNKKNAPVINKLRRLAVKNHKPMTVGFWENITNLDRQYVAEHLEAEIAKLDNNFKIVRLIQMFDFRKRQNLESLGRTFVVRNGKMWYDKDSLTSYAQWWDHVREALRLKLIQNLKEGRGRYNPSNPNEVYIKFPKRLELACPVSEKKFLGNIPFGSKFDLSGSNNYFGVYWKNEWGTRDFDLHFLDDAGNHLGWNAAYTGDRNQMIFSGDMTNADPEATEMFYMAGNRQLPDGNLELCRYNGEAGSKFRLFFGQDELNNFKKNYMVDPNTIMLSEMGESTSRTMLVGRIEDQKLQICVTGRAEGRVSQIDTDFNKAFRARAQSYLGLKEVLLAAGYTEFTKEHGEAGRSVHIDLSDLNKDTLLKLFS